MTKSIGEWQAEITAWGAEKGWDKPPLCERRGFIAIEHSELEDHHTGNVSVRDFRTNTAPEGVNVEAVGMKLALVHSEVSEALEALRDGRYVAYVSDEGKPEGVVVELADTVIRILHLAGLLGLDLEGAIELKMAHNQKRPYRHGGKLA